MVGLAFQTFFSEYSTMKLGCVQYASASYMPSNTVNFKSPYSTNSFTNETISSSVSVGDASFFLRAEAAGSSPFILDKCPQELETLQTLAPERKRGKSTRHVFSVPLTLTRMVFSACSPNGSVAAFCLK